MIIPSIDLMEGQAVQLREGRERVLSAGAPAEIARKFRLAGELAVIDLDAALGKGSNADEIDQLLKIARCRVGGGIRDFETAVRWLDRGAARIILGTAATPELLRELPRERVIAALDARDDEVVVEGWQTATGRRILERVAELRPYVSGFLVTFVEREGHLGGTDLERAQRIIEAAGHECRVTIAGGVTTAAEVAALDRMGADAQVGMALYTDRMHLADAIAAPLVSDRPDGLWPTVVTDPRGLALGLAYSSLESLRSAVDQQRGVYHSRKRGLWEKGASSGNTQQLLEITPDCDRDTLRFRVTQQGPGFCHRASYTCWADGQTGLPHLDATLAQRRDDAPAGSYTRRLFDDPRLLGAKLREEADELLAAQTKAEVTHEAADVLYFAMCVAARHGVRLADIEAELDRRTLRVTRRRGDAKARYTNARQSEER